MIVKVCGIKTESNIRDLSPLDFDMVGLNFYPSSPRYVDASVVPQWYDILVDSVSRVGVFVNMEMDDVLDFVDEYRLDYVQLHGDESLDYIKRISKHVSIIKVCRVDESFDFEDTLPYEEYIEYFLFDTATPNYGGSGNKFSWDLLQNYNGNRPYLLSGGIGPEDIMHVKSIKDPRLVGVDINSKFEISTGVKNVPLISDFLKNIKM